MPLQGVIKKMDTPRALPWAAIQCSLGAKNIPPVPRPITDIVPPVSRVARRGFSPSWSSGHPESASLSAVVSTVGHAKVEALAKEGGRRSRRRRNYFFGKTGGGAT